MALLEIRQGSDRVKVIGHRGASNICPENTLAAFSKAFELGAAWVETDIKKTADGHFVLMHDPSVDRTTNGTGKVDQLRLDEIVLLDAGTWFDAAFVGVKVPTLAELLVWSSATSCGLCLHVDGRFGTEDLHRVAEVVATSGEASKTLVISSSFEQLAAVHAACDQLTTGILYAADTDDHVDRALKAGVDFLHPHRKTVSPALIDAAHKAGLPVVACVDPQLDLVYQRLEWGIDVLSCDEPDLVLTAFDERAHKLENGDQLKK